MQRITDLQNISSSIQNYYSTQQTLPKTLEDMSKLNYYSSQTDPQSQKPYQYQKTGNTTYNLCADFNNASNDNKQMTQPYPYGGISWNHPAGHYCFTETINPSQYPPVKLPL